MKRMSWTFLPIVAVLMAGFAGCSKDNNVTQPAPMTDQIALKTQVMQSDSVAEFSSSDEATVDDSGMQFDEYNVIAPANARGFAAVTADSIYPIKWGRRIFWNEIVRDYQVVLQGDSVAVVTITKTIPGQFWVGWGTRFSLDSVVIDTVVKKPFVEDVRRLVQFRRIAHTADPFRNWVPVAITFVQGKTDSTKQFSITSFEVTANDSSNSYSDPLGTWFRLGLFHGSIPHYFNLDTVDVKVTVATADSQAEIAYLRHGMAFGHGDRHRMRMALVSTSGGPGSYTRVYEAKFVARLPLWAILAARFNAVVDVLSHGSVYSMSDPFANEFWGMPYIVTVR